MTTAPARRLAPFFGIIAVLWLCHLSSGCAYLKEAIGLGPQKPKVQLIGIDVVSVSLLALELMVTLRVDNPNDFDLSFSKLRYDLVASKMRIASGTYDDRLSMPANSHSLIKLPLRVDANAALLLAHELLTKTEDIFADLTATADFDTPFGAMQVNFEDKRPLRKLAGF